MFKNIAKEIFDLYAIVVILGVAGAIIGTEKVLSSLGCFKDKVSGSNKI